MPIPSFEQMMKPLLELALDGKGHSLKEALEYISDQYQLSMEEREARLPSGPKILNNRIGWARTFLKKAGLLIYETRGSFSITEAGKKVLASGENIDVRFLKTMPGFEEAWQINDQTQTQVDQSTKNKLTPEEELNEAHGRIRRRLEEELLAKTKSCSPDFFERLVVELIVRMGYGGSIEDAGRAVGRSGDGGIDGIINEDRLGLDVVYIQAKRWDGVVGRPELMKFAGALQGQRAKKGIFITTSSFTKEAIVFVRSIDVKIVLIDGDDLTRYMVDHDVGCTPIGEYKVKKVDPDYFDESL